MPREKQSKPESGDVSASVLLPVDAGQKTVNGSAKIKMTLVKPPQTKGTEMKSENDSSTGNEVRQKPSTRPKVGRPAGARKKKSNGKEAKAEQAIRKETRPRKKEPEIEPSVVVAEEPAKAAATPAIDGSGAGKVEAASVEAAPPETMDEPQAKQLQEALAQVDLPAEWHAEHSRPWSFKSILSGVALFVLINLGMIALVNVSHKAKSPAPAKTASVPVTVPAPKTYAVKTTSPEVSRPAVPPALNAAPAFVSVAPPAARVTPPAALPPAAPANPKPAIAAATPAVPAASVSPPAAAPADVPANAAPQPKNPQELLAIITKE